MPSIGQQGGFHYGAERVLDVTKGMNTALRYVFLNRITKNEKGHYTIQNPKIKPILFCVMMTAIEAFLFYCRGLPNTVMISSSRTITLIFTTDIVVTMLIFVQYTWAVSTAVREKADDIQQYYHDMQEVDEMLALSQAEYKKDKMQTKVWYICVILIRMTASVVEYWMWVKTFGFEVTVPHFLELFVKVSMELLFADYIAKLILFKNRLIAMRRRIVGFGEEPVVVSVDRARGNIIEVKDCTRGRRSVEEYISCCYLLMCKQSCSLNGRYSFQLVFNIGRVIISAISATHLMISVLTSSKSIMEGMAPTAAVVPAALYLVDVIESFSIMVILIEYVMSIKRQLRVIRITAEKYLADNRSMSAPQREAWTRFVSLCRRQRVEFTAGGFFKLDYSLLAGMFGTMITYTVILTQMNEAT